MIRDEEGRMTYDSAGYGAIVRTRTSHVQLLLILVSVVVVGFASFWAVAAIMDGREDDSTGDERRAADARLLMAALDHYHQKHGGKFPFNFADNPIQDLSAELAGLVKIPHDPRWSGGPKDYRYVSAGDGTKYGLGFYLERAAGSVPAGGSCITGVGFDGTGWWGQQPTCPF
jgi:hypothetical protein